MKRVYLNPYRCRKLAPRLRAQGDNSTFRPGSPIVPAARLEIYFSIMSAV
jgi:hypothetical protein